MTAKNSIIESLGYIIVTIIAAALTYVGGTVVENIDASSVGGRIEALPMLGISLVLGHGYSLGEMRAAVYAGGFVIYFLAGLVVMSLVRDAIKNYRAKKAGSSGTRII
jgi:hypothetical protein